MYWCLTRKFSIGQGFLGRILTSFLDSSYLPSSINLRNGFHSNKRSKSTETYYHGLEKQKEVFTQEYFWNKLMHLCLRTWKNKSCETSLASLFHFFCRTKIQISFYKNPEHCYQRKWACLHWHLICMTCVHTYIHTHTHTHTHIYTLRCHRCLINQTIIDTAEDLQKTHIRTLGWTKPCYSYSRTSDSDIVHFLSPHSGLNKLKMNCQSQAPVPVKLSSGDSQAYFSSVCACSGRILWGVGCKRSGNRKHSNQQQWNLWLKAHSPVFPQGSH